MASKVRVRHYKLAFMEHTRTAEGRAHVAHFLVNNSEGKKFSPTEAEEIVNTQLPRGQKPFEFETEQPVATPKRSRKS